MTKDVLLLPLATLISFGCAVSNRTIKDIDRLEAVHRVAVLPFNCSDRETGVLIAESLVAGLLKSRFVVLERSQVERLLVEQGFSVSDNVDSTALMVGKLKCVDAIIVGSATVAQGQSPAGTVSYVVDCAARLVDLSSGEVIMATTYSAAQHKGKKDPFVTAAEVGQVLAADFRVQ